MSSTVKVHSNEPVRSKPRFRLRHLQFALEIIALLITGYMSYNKFAGTSLVCPVDGGAFDCNAVEASRWAYNIGLPPTLFGSALVLAIPTATLGLIAHLLITSVLVLETRVRFFRANGVLLLFGMTLFFSLIHLYLMYVSVAIIQRLCIYCLVAATIMLIQLFLNGVRLRRQWADVA